MANICCDDVIFYTEGNPEGLYDLWEDLETYIILTRILIYAGLAIYFPTRK